MNVQRLTKDIRVLSCVYPVAVSDDYRSLIVQEFNLPPGYNAHLIRILLEIPKKYPVKPPGVGSSHVYVPSSLRFRGRRPEDFHESIGPNSSWAWWCYEWIKWDPCKDSLITFFELLRAHMTNPETEGIF